MDILVNDKLVKIINFDLFHKGKIICEETLYDKDEILELVNLPMPEFKNLPVDSKSKLFPKLSIPFKNGILEIKGILLTSDLDYGLYGIDKKYHTAIILDKNEHIEFIVDSEINFMPYQDLFAFHIFADSYFKNYYFNGLVKSEKETKGSPTYYHGYKYFIYSKTNFFKPYLKEDEVDKLLQVYEKVEFPPSLAEKLGQNLNKNIKGIFNRLGEHTK